MQWDDTGYLLSKNKYNENSIIAEFFSVNHGKCSGIIFGGTSRKIKNYLEIGNKLNINYTFKNENRLGYFKVEILKALTPLYFDNKKKLMSISSAMSLVKLLTAESQENSKIFRLIDDFFMILSHDDWLKDYIFWELNLLKLVGYDLELDKYVNRIVSDGKTKYVVNSNSGEKIIPNFLIDKSIVNVDYKNLIIGLKLLGDYLEKSILRPNNVIYPQARIDFYNALK